MAALKLGLIGNGAIARQIAKYCDAHAQRFAIVGALTKPDQTRPAGDYPLVRGLAELLDLRPTLVIECAGHAAVKQFGAQVLSRGIELVLVSVGSLCDESLLAQLRRAEAEGNTQLIIAAGALPGMDTLSTAALAGLQNVKLQSSKPPAAWRGTPAEATHNLGRIASPTVIFEGNAREAALLYPKNANVAATAALAGIGFERTRVVLIADPGISHNRHLLEASGAFGRLSMAIEATPSPDNPKTSMIAALSVLKILEQEATKYAHLGNRNVSNPTEKAAPIVIWI